MSLLAGVGDFGINDLKDQAVDAKNLALGAVETIQEGKDLGPWNAQTNSPVLTNNASAVVAGGYYTVTVAGVSTFAGANFPSGQAFGIGDRIKKIGGIWYRSPFIISAGAEISTVGGTDAAIMNRKETQLEIGKRFPVKFYSRNLFDRNSVNIQQGKAIDATGPSGNILTSTGYALSDYMAVLPGEQYTFSNMGAFKAVRFESASHGNLGGLVIPNNTTTTITTPANCYFIVYTCKANGEPSIPANYQVEKGTVATAYDTFKAAVEQAVGLPLAAKYMADQGVMLVAGSEPTSLVNRQAVSEMLPTYNKVVSRNMFNRAATDFQLNKSIDASSTSGQFFNSPGYWISGYMPVNPNEKITFSGHGNLKAVRFEDANHNNLGGAILANSVNTTVTTPVGCSYIIFTIKNSGEGNIPASYQVERGETATAYMDYIQQVEGINGMPIAPYWHDLNGLKLLILGDSIATVYPEGGGYSAEWPTYIRKPYWGNIYHAAMSGARIKDDPDTPGLTISPRQRLSGQIDYAIANNWQPDVITLFIGTNDLIITNTGDYDTAMGKTDLASLDRSKLYEALRYAYWKITTQWPNAKVFHALPLQRASVTIDVQKTIKDAIIKMAINYCVIVIHADVESGISRQFEVANGNGRYLRDGLHPNDTGKAKLADYYMRKVIAGLL
ncbi:SGNH/GDSL hydrolase family protein [Spirosoma agri]|uniref:SGNH/GDSL hydrolase family protein n=1 Tax=Spirosoma agri TaxID=1987381 RepID=A0A6M0ILH5_9BACT|nr:SGNH/GDSL hydrolase family protein [Spirosoma agri]NEU67753.1 SGNH/GDSL hydrolase family protein [Spirosoma agri]